MYMESAYWKNQLQDFVNEEYPLFVCSCGAYRMLSRPKLHTYRPNGRVDYQILYIASGKAYFSFNGKEQMITAGNMVIYRPLEEQHYYYYSTDHTEFYWMHFTGNNVENILYKYGITKDMHVIHTGTSLEYKNIFLQIIKELKLCKEDYEELLMNYLQHLLILIHRAITSTPRSKPSSLIHEMDAAVRYFHENYNKPISIENYAAEHHMSVSWFIRNFKDYTNSTPTQYLLTLRIQNAQTLLESTSYNVTEIAEIVGYDNPLYFSRIFKKHNGMSPSDFRKQLAEK